MTVTTRHQIASTQGKTFPFWCSCLQQCYKNEIVSPELHLYFSLLSNISSTWYVISNGFCSNEETDQKTNPGINFTSLIYRLILFLILVGNKYPCWKTNLAIIRRPLRLSQLTSPLKILPSFPLRILLRQVILLWFNVHLYFTRTSLILILTSNSEEFSKFTSLKLFNVFVLS